MDRRAFTTMIGGTILARPRASEGQLPGKVARIGMLRSTTEPPDFGNMTLNLQMFRDGLRDHGYVEGRNLAIEYRYPRARTEQLEALRSNSSMPLDLRRYTRQGGSLRRSRLWRTTSRPTPSRRD
jgi:hypothetical protein